MKTLTKIDYTMLRKSGSNSVTFHYNIFDKHYGNRTVQTIVTALFKGRTRILVIDRNGSIKGTEWGIDEEGNENMVIDNNASYGNMIDGEFEGWCWDRDDCVLPFNIGSTKYYAEKSA